MPFVDSVLWISVSGLLVWAALSDGRTLTIPNRLCLAVAILYLGRLPIIGTAAWLEGIAVGTAILAFGFLAFSRGWLGGGDAKLLAAVGLWAGPGHVLAMLTITALAGGVLTALVLARRYTPFLLSPGLRATEHGAPAVPYGIAIAAGGIWLAAIQLGILATPRAG